MERADEIERLAITGCEVPREYNQPEQLLFLSLRIMHWEYRHQIISLEQARREKECLLSTFFHAQRWDEIYRDTVRIRNAMSHVLVEAEKNGCAQCRELIRLFDGRKNT